MIDHQSLFEMLRRANPVPDPDLLLSRERTVPATTTEREAEMPTTLAPRQRRALDMRSRPRLGIALGLVLFAVLIGVGLIVTRQQPVLAPSELPERFFAAINDSDSQAFHDLFAQDAAILGVGNLADGEAAQYLEDYFAFRAVTDSTFVADCGDVAGDVDGSVSFRCAYEWENAVTRGLGVAPTTGTVVMAVGDGEIANLISDGFDLSNMAWPFPVDYMAENVPSFSTVCDTGDVYLALGEECARVIVENLGAMAEAWEQR